MKNEYKDWINLLVKEKGKIGLIGNCQFYSRKMQEQFSELIICRGYVLLSLGGKRGHWWCKTEDEEIIDPTAIQFSDKDIILEYEEFDPIIHGLEPFGKCMNCGDLSYRKNNPSTCSEKCEKEILNYLNG